MRFVTGRVLLDGRKGKPGSATVYVRLLDTSRADAPAVVLSALTLDEVDLDLLEQDGIEFALDAPRVDPRARYTVSVLVDLDGDGQSSPGDYVSTRAYPVLTRGHGQRVEVRAERIA